MPQPTPIKTLIGQAEAYLTGGARLFAIEWAEAVRDALKDTTFGHRIATELSVWLGNEEPQLEDALIRRALGALRKAAA